MKKLLVGLVGALFAGLANAATGVVTNGTELVFTVDSGTLNYSDAIPSGVTTIVKRGTGTLNLSRDENTFAGTFTIEQGRVMGKCAAYGTPEILEIKSGADIYINEANKNLNAGVLKIAGTGTDGKGAVVYVGGYDTWYYVNKTVELTDDAKFYVTANSRKMLCTTLTMNGHTLTTATDGMVSLKETTLTINEPGDIAVGNYQFNIDGSKIKQGTGVSLATKNISVSNGKYLILYNMNHSASDPMPMGVTFNGTSYLSCYNGTDGAKNYIGAPLTLKGTLTAQAYNSNGASVNGVTFGGGFSGGGSVVFPSDKSPVTVTFCGPHTNSIGSVSVSNSSVFRLKDGVGFCVTNGMIAVASASVASPATISVEDNAWLGYNAAYSGRNAYLRIASSENTYGLLKISGGTVSNRLMVADGKGGVGAIYMDSGVFRTVGTDAQWLANYGNGYGYFGMAGGSFWVNTWLYLGQVNSTSIFHQKGGKFDYPGGGYQVLRMGKYGSNTYAHLRQSGGTANVEATVAMGYGDNWEASGMKNVYTIDGTAVVNAPWGYLRMYASTNLAEAAKGNYQSGIVNLNGGVTCYRRIQRFVNPDNDANWNLVKDHVGMTNPFYLNFNGGTLKAGDSIIIPPGKGPSRITVYAGGATIDTAGYNVNWPQPFEKPTGKGLKSVTLPAAALAANAYMGPARICISGTNGHRADAVMDFDETTRTVTGVTVTAPGFDLGDDIAVTVRKSKNDPDDVYTAADGVGFELETLPTTGGLTKKGAGNLTVTGVNTYGGPTRIEQGTLVFATENGYPGGDLELSAETLNGKDAATPLLTAVNFALASGKKVRITQAEKLDKASFAKTKVVASFTQPLAALPELEFVNSDNTVVANADYGLRLTDGGKTLKFGLTRGMVLIFR